MNLENKINCTFVDTNSEVVISLVKKFYLEPNFEFYCGNILNCEPGVLVSPCNRVGNMDGGIDRLYSEVFPGIEQRLKAYINEDYGGKMDFGDAQIIPTQNKKYPYIIFTPTVDYPGALAEKENISLAVKALFNEIDKFNLKNYKQEKIENLLIPGFGTYYGGLDPDTSAQAMYKGYINYKNQKNLLNNKENNNKDEDINNNNGNKENYYIIKEFNLNKEKIPIK